MLEEAQTFIQVIQSKSFSKAGEKLGISTATVTRRIMQLEASFGTALLQRTTRSLSLTEAGALAYDNLKSIIQTVTDTKENIRSLSNEIVGSLKVGIPNSIIKYHVIPALPKLTQAYPKLHIELVHGNHLLDLIDDGFDLVVHCGELPNVNFYAQKLANWQQVVCTSPSYLEKHGTPTTLDELNQHNCLIHYENAKQLWKFQQNNKTVFTPVTGNLRSNSSGHLKSLALAGEGIAYLPSFSIFNEIQSGDLIPLLSNFHYGPLAIYAVYPDRRNLSSKAKIFIDFLRSLPFLSESLSN